jgi:hypothetical protein
MARRRSWEITVDYHRLHQIVEREHPITIRGVFYRAVSKGMYLTTDDRFYRQCDRDLGTMRLGKMFDYEWIVDGTRSWRESTGHDSLKEYLDVMATSYQRNYWLDQPVVVAVLTEKDAMTTILQPVIEKYNVPWTVFRGHPSDTLTYQIGKALVGESRPIHCLYLGDHDPSGLNISEVAKAKIEEHSGLEMNWKRVAVDHDQFRTLVGQFGVPINKDDPKAYDYIRKYGYQRVEVDAIPTGQVRQMLTEAIVKLIDQDAWNKSVDLEQQERSQCEAEIQAVKSKMEESDV